MNNDIKQIIKKINYKEFDIELSYFQKWCISVIVSLAIVYLMFDPMNNFLRTFQSGGYIAFFAILLWFVCPFLAFASIKGSISFYNKSDWALFAKAFFKSIIVCLFSLLLCIFFFLTGCITLMVRYTYFVGLVGFLFFILNYIVKEEPLIHTKSNNILSILGPKNSGKTVFLVMLLKELRSDISWYCNDMKAAPLDKIYTEFIRKGNLPEPTLDKIIHDESWNILIAKKENKNLLIRPVEFLLNVADVSGEFFDKYEDDQYKNDEFGYFERISKSSALMLILPAKHENPLDILQKTLEANFNQIRNRFQTDKISIPVAICISKIDIDEVYQRYLDSKRNSKQVFEDLFGKNIINTLGKYLSKYKFFCFSSVGIEEINGKYTSLLKKDANNREYLPKDGKIKPIGITEPLEWFASILK
jgi:hypothetical protein